MTLFQIQSLTTSKEKRSKTKTSEIIIGKMGDILTRYFLNTSLGQYRYANFSGEEDKDFGVTKCHRTQLDTEVSLR
jgi:hypothetical protein